MVSCFRTRVPVPWKMDRGRPHLHLHGAQRHDRLRVLRWPHHGQGGPSPSRGRSQLRARPRPAARRHEADAGVQVLRQLPPKDALAVLDGGQQRPGLDHGLPEQEDHGSAPVARARAQQRDRLERGVATAERRHRDDRRRSRRRRHLRVNIQQISINITCQL